MGVPWKKIGKGLLKGLGIAAVVDPLHFAAFAPLVELAENFGGTGAEKKAAVMKTLEAEISLLAPEDQDEARALYSDAIDAYVAARNAEAKAQDAIDKAQAFIDAVRKRAA